MTRVFGSRSTFAIEVGDLDSPQIRRVNVWVGDRRLTFHDDIAYVPSLWRCMNNDAARVGAGSLPANPAPDRGPDDVLELLDSDDTEWREGFWLLRWSEILDSATTYGYLDDAELVIVGRLWHPDTATRGDSFVARTGRDTFTSDVLSAAAYLVGS